ncbi:MULTISPECIES: type II glyceraldehyde-3-phosphate dehydrogenase [Halobacterium]|uniref:Glyceraldehyde-3-phosphate dehydrogenase n=5 Tax=Halobacterium salinarum TaxID=2242 RepID=G3P_HALSA|nr:MULTISPECIES: type II glyceraldehyde-3-phosphate dehydrogenase [Halobacterium]B0R2M2.1 RecName: Full=Glyceraldehyde-3-phosphate dehydrogenase; Short=GAPDH; AltName: Full=NAD(P)-dependent glyceraldehyde-3-phosphate dehydrogenase [Halobacterium salinarum R1]Q9HSS7.1 RecName: Full=Glyceraldehyde-3-phosphate dehydrogenase; Short=GAPDH; AltName: Full=NAD(P)-dependent glyceraldehyde-3-phosphate dehydrogenase [Halobacterium salinarum NRC-1]AAG18725.1 glyceraldehyde 3-phosphate dehydrogenase [Halobac
MIRVGINGYGTIGKRVADAVAAQPDMTVAGVAKTSPNFEATQARKRGFDLYTAVEDRADQFPAAGIETAGPVDDLIADSDVVVDATPSGVGAENRSRYAAHDTPAIYQGGEDASVADVSFNARANFEAAADADHVRVVSCNTTGLSRLLAPLREQYGIEKVRATLVRRGGDPGQTDRGPINDILPDPITIPSHHGPDVNTIFPDLDIDTLGMKVPATLMHMHSINVTLERDPDAADVRDVLAGQSRIMLLDDDLGIDGTGPLKEYAQDMGRPRGDLWENCLWGESVTMDGRDFYCFQAIHQESDVVPENVDAVRAIAGDADAAESIATTNDALGI